MSFFTLKVHAIGLMDPLVDKLIFFDDTLPNLPHETSCHLCSIIKKEVMASRETTKHQIVFNEEQHIDKVAFPGGTCAKSLLDVPVLYLLKALGSFEKKTLTINICPDTVVKRSNSNTEPIDLVTENQVVVTMLSPSFEFECVQEFQQNFKNRTVSRYDFLRNVDPKPNYSDQIESAVLHVMANPPEGMKRCGYNERLGGKKARLKQLAEAERAKLDPTYVVKKPTKIAEATEASRLKKAVKLCVKSFTFIQDHRSTLEPRNLSLFNTPILNAIVNADPQGTKQKELRKVDRMTHQSVTRAIQSVHKAISALPSWYKKKKNKTDRFRTGEAILSELEGVEKILNTYLKHLNEQSVRNVEEEDQKELENAQALPGKK